MLSLQEYRNRQSIGHKGTYRIICLGDSTTANQYPPFLERILNQRNMGVRFSIINKGLGHTTTTTILAELESNLDAYYPAMVMTMMGANDMGPYIPHEEVAVSKIVIFLKSFRTYKLIRLLWFDIMTEAREMRLQAQIYLSGIKLKDAHTVQTSIGLTEASLKKAIELNPQNDYAYTELGNSYLIQGKFSQAEDALKQAIALNPQNERAHVELGRCYREQGKFFQVEDLLKKAIELNPQNDDPYIRLGTFYITQRKFFLAEAPLKKAIELSPQNDRAYIKLARLYLGRGKPSQAEDLLRKVSELKNERAYRALSAVYRELGKPELAKVYVEKADRLRLEEFNPITAQNYRRLKDILDKRGIRLVCVQYPIRSIVPLKRIFQGKEEDIIFVDNERIFRDAVNRDGYDTYFQDAANGDYGHCTDKGNKLLAENIANTILKEVFHK
jgi:tetratricopeptide (TPR) repeat protein